MDHADQVAAYSIAGRIDGVMAAAYLFHSARISMVISGCPTALDLGCGPCTQLGQIAELNPKVSFTGVDLSGPMIEDGRAHISQLGLTNVKLAHGDITRLSTIADHSMDAVISTMALHHLPTDAQLRFCFREIKRVLKPGGAIYVADFARLKSLKSVISLAYMNRAYQPHLFSLDYERSLRAAFLFDELKTYTAEEISSDLDVVGTFLVPLLVIIKTADRPASEQLRHRLKSMRANLPRRYRSDLDDLRRFFAWGGLPGDPFR